MLINKQENFPDVLSRCSYLAPILRSVGIAEPVKITLINVGLGKHLTARLLFLHEYLLPSHLVIQSQSPCSRLQPYRRHNLFGQRRQIRPPTVVFGRGRRHVLDLCDYHGPIGRVRFNEEVGNRRSGRSVPLHVCCELLAGSKQRGWFC
jgi:hypothetical protein